MKIKKQTKYKNPKLAVAYYYENFESDSKNSDVFIYDDKKGVNLETEFLKYANKYHNWNVEESDIIAVYEMDYEEDYKGRGYDIIVK